MTKFIEDLFDVEVSAEEFINSYNEYEKTHTGTRKILLSCKDDAQHDLDFMINLDPVIPLDQNPTYISAVSRLEKLKAAGV